MENQKLYKSDQGKASILAMYDAKLASLNLAYESRIVETSFGETHLLVCGQSENPPLFLLHGSNGNAPIALETYPDLFEKYQVFAIDVLAQPNKSAENRLSMKDLSYGAWIHELINILDLDHLTLAGFSFGGLIILKALLFSGQKIKHAFLAAPAFIVNGNPLVALFKVFIPMKKYMRTQNKNQVKAFLKALFTSPDAFAVDFLSEVFLHFNMDFSPIPVITSTEAAGIKTPITLFAADQDIIFPGKKMITRAKKIFPSLHATYLLEKSKHVQNQQDNDFIQALILQEA